jgi:transketolase
MIATGSEVEIALQAQSSLSHEGIRCRVVSMPCWELFEAQPPGYRQRVLPADVPRLGVEAARAFGWRDWADDVVSLDRFGASAPADVLFREFGFTPENVAARARWLLAKGGRP